jgi:DNA-binding GntR family transcriptional regulator
MSHELPNDDVASLTEKAYQAISGAIARLELKPGETLTQDRLAKWLAISRTPVREALRRLEQEGLIQNVSSRGLIVTELTVKDVEDLLELLCTLDTQAAYLAAQRRTPEQAEQLNAIAQELLLAAEQHDVEAWSRIDKPYHELLLAAAGNHSCAARSRMSAGACSVSPTTSPSSLSTCCRVRVSMWRSRRRSAPQMRKLRPRSCASTSRR